MKKYSIALSFIVLLCSLVSSCSIKNVCDKMDDTAFMHYCYNYFDANYDRKLSTKEAEEVNVIDISYEGISSLKGIEFFTNLSELNCSGNQLKQLDVSNNTHLKKLDCSSNEIASLDVSKNTLLESLDCSSNELTSLDASKNTQLIYLTCNDNKLAKLVLGKNDNLEDIYCKNNNLARLDVSKNTKLVSLECSNNQLAELDLGKTQLEIIECQDNLLTNLDVSNTTQLKYFTCNNNRLTKIRLGKNEYLESFHCENNNLSSLDLGMITNLRDFDCNNNKISNLDLSKNAVLHVMNCIDNPLAVLDLSNNDNLGRLYCPESLLLSLKINPNAPLSELITDKQDLSLQAIDLGLSVKWASLNLGASHIDDPGDHFSWGETETKDEYSWENYKWDQGHNFGNHNFTKYNNDYRDGIVDNIMELDPEDDVARKRLGGGWRMPRAEEFEELLDTTNCLWKSIRFNDEMGYIVISKKTGNYIILPSTAMGDGTATHLYSSSAFYWSSSINPYSFSQAKAFYGDGGYFKLETSFRNCGLSIRPVLD